MFAPALLAFAPLLLPQADATFAVRQQPEAARADGRAQQQPEEVPLLAEIPLLSTMFVEQQQPIPDPDLYWDGETEDVYRRAMHLIQVRAKYDEGIGLLLSIADKQEVIQRPGQASWVLAQAALAMMQSGRAAEAAAMVTGIRNGAVGTELEPQVEFRLSQIAALQEQGAQPLDESFRNFLWERLRAYPRDENDRGSDIFGYGRLALPYLEELIRGQLALGAAGHDADIVQASKATHFALRLADEPFAHRFAALLAQYPPLTTRVLLDRASVSGVDDVAERAQLVFYGKLSQDADPGRRELGTERLIDAMRRYGSAEDIPVLMKLARDGDAPQRKLLAEALAAGTIYGSAAWTGFAGSAAAGDDDALRAAARWGMLRDGNREALVRFLEEDARLVDKVRYLASFKAVDPDSATTRRGGNDPAEVARRELATAALAAIGESGLLDALPHGWSVSMSVDAADRARITTLAGDPDPGIAAYACLVAADSRDDALVQSVFQATDGKIRQDLLKIVARGHWNYSPETAQTLLQMAIAGDRNAHMFLNDTGMRHLDVAALVTSGLEWTRGGGNSGWHGHMEDAFHAKDWVKVADVVALAELDDMTRSGGINQLQSKDRGEFLRAVSSIGAWEFEGGPWSTSVFGSVFNGLHGASGQGRGFPADVPVGLFVACLDKAWEVAQEYPTIRGSFSLPLQFKHLWERSPEAAYDQARRLLKSPADLDFYVDRGHAKPFSDSGRAQAQRLVLDLATAGVWDLEQRGVPVYDESQPEFQPLVARLFAKRSTTSQALAILRYVDPRWREVFAKELDAAWVDPVLSYDVLRIYDARPEIRQLVDKLLAAWEVEGLRQRASFLNAMGTTLDERVVPVLLDQLGSTDSECREAARAALERMREIREQREFWAAWEATGSAVSPAVALIQKLKSDNRAVRLASIRSLGTMKSAEALPFLVDLLEDDDQAVREAAAAALEKINAD